MDLRSRASARRLAPAITDRAGLAQAQRDDPPCLSRSSRVRSMPCAVAPKLHALPAFASDGWRNLAMRTRRDARPNGHGFPAPAITGCTFRSHGQSQKRPTCERHALTRRRTACGPREAGQPQYREYREYRESTAGPASPVARDLRRGRFAERNQAVDRGNAIRPGRRSSRHRRRIELVPGRNPARSRPCTGARKPRPCRISQPRSAETQKARQWRAFRLPREDRRARGQGDRAASAAGDHLILPSL